MRRVKLEPVRAAFAVALVAATLAFALAILAGPWLLVVLVTCALPFFEWTAVPAALVRTLPRGVGLLLLVTGVLAWLSRSMGALILDESLLPRVAGPLLLASAIVFSLAPRRFPAGRTLLPATIGLLAVSGLDPRPEGYGPTTLGFLKGSEHTAFAERYLALALLVLVALWTGAFLARGPRWSARATAGLALTLVVSVALAATGIIGLPLLQPHVERAVASTFVEASTGLSGESRLGEFAELALSHKRVLDLQTSLPSGGAWLLPSEVLLRFDGKLWARPAASPAPSGASDAPRALRPATPPAAPGPLVDGLGRWFEVQPRPTVAMVEMRVTQAEVAEWPLLLPRGTRSVTADAWLLTLDGHGLLRRPEGQALRLYGATWSAAPEHAGRAPALSAAEREASLSLPSRLDPRLVSLARKVAPSDRPARERVAATLAHLRDGGYRYTLAVGTFRTDDPLAEFLFEKKAGYCEYFATAAVMLLRQQGVPARYVKGLAVGPHSDQGGGLHVVRESAAHAWVEAWVEGDGWIEVDPTPPGDFAAAHPPPSAAGRLTQRLRAALATAWRRLVDLGPMAFLRALADDLGRLLEIGVRSPGFWTGGAVVAIALLRRRLWRAATRFRAQVRRKRDPDAEGVPPDLRGLVRELERRWAQAGRKRPPSRGLLEHARSQAPAGAPRGGAPVDAGAQVVEAYYRARFAGTLPSPAELETLRAALEASGREDATPSVV